MRPSSCRTTDAGRRAARSAPPTTARHHDPDPRAAFRPDLIVRDFQPDRTALDARWCGDITYVPTEEGWPYLATVIDIASRRVAGWATADDLRTELVAEALTAGCGQRRPTHPVIFHSDRGCQYTSQQFATLAARFEVRPSVGRTGRCWDNGARRVVLLNHQTRTARHLRLAQPGRSPHRDLRLHRRLVQLAPTAQQLRLPQPRRVRDRPRSLATTPMVSVKVEQAHRPPPAIRVLFLAGLRLARPLVRLHRTVQHVHALLVTETFPSWGGTGSLERKGTGGPLPRHCQDKDQGVIMDLAVPQLPLDLPSRLHPHEDRAQQHTQAWVQEMGMIANSPKAREVCDSFLLGRLAARVYPHASVGRLYVLADWTSAYFILDDVLDDTVEARDPEVATEIADQFIAPFLGTAPRTGPHRVGDVLAVSRIREGLADLWARTRPGMTAAWANRLVHDMTDYLYSHVRQSEINSFETPFDEDAYCAHRLLTSASTSPPTSSRSPPPCRCSNT